MMELKKNYILDSLIDDDEAKTQIMEYFALCEVAISDSELETLLSEMVEEGLIVVNDTWKNEKDEYPYSLTEKGKAAWEALEE